MSMERTCACSAAPKLVFSCSGAADVGAVTDQAARKLTRDGLAKMFCLAGIGGRISGIMKSTEAASAILALDGCPTACVKHCLEQAGISNFAYVQLADLGMEKGKTAVDEDHIGTVAAAAAEILAKHCAARTPNTPS